MRIKKLEIVGFKSFCDRTVLHFNDPITGVVGPNGCGKSNIVDAIRWCMGEQSAKYLRGKAMDDVIFGGSDARGPAGMAEVSLTFENDGRVPVEYLAYSEITVTRRLFKDGTSEYLLNQTPCRLRDVTDFFLGTGVGTKAYSIIEQGKVGMLVSSKPEDRRFLIEEAAGITKYKLKRKAAEKKMESTRQNLLRVSDVVAEIEKQLGSLRRQAQKAERYRQYKAEVRDIELWSASQRWLGVAVESRVADERLAVESERRGAAQTAVAARDAEIAAARLTDADEERTLAAAQERLYELDNRVRLGEAEAEHQEREARGLDERAAAAAAESGVLERQTADGRAELARLGDERDHVESARAAEAERLAAAETCHREAREELARVQRELDGVKGEIGKAQADIARGDGSERSLTRRLEDLDLRVGRVGEEEARLGARDGELKAQIEALGGSLDGQRRDQTRIDAARETHEMRLAEVKDELGRTEVEFESLRAELGKRQSRHASLEEIHARYEGFARGTRAVMQQKEKAGDGDGGWGIHGLVADVIEAPAELEMAVEAALGERLGSVVVESHEVSMDVVERLRAGNQGRSSFAPLKARARDLGEGGAGPAPEGTRGPLAELVKTAEEYQGLAQALLGDVLVVEDLLQAIDLWRAGERRRMVTVEGDVIDALGVVTGGSREAEGAGVLQQKRELRELEEAIARLDEQHRAMADRRGALKAEREELETALAALRIDRHRGEMAVLTHEKDLHRLAEEQARLVARGAQLQREREELLAQRAEAAREAEELRLEMRAARERLAAAEERHHAHGRDAVARYERVDEAAAALTAEKVLAASAQEKRAALGQAIARLEAQLEDYDRRRERLARAVDEDGARAAELRAGVAGARERLVELAESSRQAAEALRTGRAAHETRRAALLEAEGHLKAARTELDALAATCAELEFKLRDLARDRAHLEEQVAERWRVLLVDQLHDHHLRPPVGEAEEQRLAELRDLIDRMGEINLTAIDEYRVLEERYTFLVGQKSDLESALGQLEEAIAQINLTSKARFREVFDLVNLKFQELFPRLFRGGHALLKLTNEDDVLESGIEIVAVPPGKKNTTLELLSGGEKALTAVSLIFAIFLVKPSPFCLLDEVDAPLDEANVGRFNDLVRAMTDRSQFIIITHNKRTMEIVDTLYGVTMEQPGISKLVSVNLTAIGRKAAA